MLQPALSGFLKTFPIHSYTFLIHLVFHTLNNSYPTKFFRFTISTNETTLRTNTTHKIRTLLSAPGSKCFSENGLLTTIGFFQNPRDESPYPNLCTHRTVQQVHSLFWRKRWHCCCLSTVSKTF